MPRVKITDAVFGRQETGVAVLLDGASVLVNEAGGSAATVYEDDSSGTTLANPVTSEDGRIPGYLVEGRYELVVTYDSVTADAVPFEARAGYPSGASDGQILTWDADTEEVVWADADAITAGLPWTIDISPFLTAATQTNWSTRAVDTSQITGGLKSSTGTVADDEIGWDVVLAAGTWTIEWLYVKGSNVGIFTVSLDGSSVGTVDGYAASTTYNSNGSITGVTVDSTGKKRLLFKMATKNASSSAYRGNLSAIRLLRTA